MALDMVRTVAESITTRNTRILTEIYSLYRGLSTLIPNIGTSSQSTAQEYLRTVSPQALRTLGRYRSYSPADFEDFCASHVQEQNDQGKLHLIIGTNDSPVVKKIIEVAFISLWATDRLEMLYDRLVDDLRNEASLLN